MDVEKAILLQVDIPMTHPIECSRQQRGINPSALDSISNVYLSNQSFFSFKWSINIEMVLKNKQELQYMIDLCAPKWNFEFIVKKSTFVRWEITHIKDTCKWQMRATWVKGIDYFAIKIFNNHYKYSSLWDIYSNHCQASSKLIGDHIKSKYIGIAC